jgi:hypothetical protein
MKVLEQLNRTTGKRPTAVAVGELQDVEGRLGWQVPEAKLIRPCRTGRMSASIVDAYKAKV